MPADQLDITVIVRTSDRPLLFLRRALASISAQTCAPAMVLVMNDGLNHADVDAEVNRTECRSLLLRHLRRDPTSHPLPNRSAALNRGIAACQTRWIAFLDDDDTWSPDFIKRIASILETAGNRPEFGGVIVQTEAVYERLKEGRISETHRIPFNPSLIAIDLATLAVENRFTLNAMVVRRDVFSTIGGYREDLPVLEDWEFNVRAATRFAFDVIPEALARYHLRRRGESSPNTAPLEMARTGVRIRNEWLRADIAAGRLGLGQLSLAGENRGVAAELTRWVRLRSKIAAWFGRSSR